MRSQTCEITFAGQEGTTLRAEFDNGKGTIGPVTISTVSYPPLPK